MPHFLRAGRRNFRPEKLSAFQLFGRNYDFGFARKTGFMPQLRLIYMRNPPLNFVWAVSTLRCIKCFLMICTKGVQKVRGKVLPYSYFVNQLN